MRPGAVKWAVRDAARLARLLQHVTSIRSALAELVPPDMERLKLQVLVDTISETTTGDLTAVMTKAISSVGEQSPSDAPVMQTISASLLLRQQLPQWLSQVDAARVSAKALFIQDAEFSCGRDNIPQDLARWTTSISSRSRGLASADVLIEWRLCGDNENSDQFERDTLMLANLLSCMSNHPDTHLPRCHGYVKSRSRLGLRFGLVLAVLPRPTESVQSGGTHTSVDRGMATACNYKPLIEAITPQPYPLPDLSLRVQIALGLARSVFHLLSAGVLHKAIRSDSIMSPIHSLGSSRLDTSEFILCAFEFSRLDIPGQISRHARDHNNIWDLYRHPMSTSKAWETKRYKDKGYIAEYDIYSLGVVLAELGLWRDVHGLFTKAAAKAPAGLAAEDFAPLFLNRVNLELPGMSGRRYAGVVRWCLEFGSKETSEQTTAELLMDYEKNVVLELMRCHV